MAKRLVLAASGQLKADLVIKQARLINVYSGEIIPGTDVAVKYGRIVYVGPNAGHTVGDTTRIIKAQNRFLAPGFIDAHTHLDLYCTPREFVKGFMRHGTTCVFAEPAEFVSVFGYEGMKLFLREVSGLPIKVFSLVPMCSLQDPKLGSSREMSPEEVEEAMGREEVLGLGETVAWNRILNLDADYFRKMDAARSANKRVEGHTAGAHDYKLSALAAAGISSCHEAVQERDVYERLRLGLWTMLRHGGVRNDLAETIPALIKGRLDTRRAILVSDGMDPGVLAREGHMDLLVREAITLGLNPVTAVQMASLNPAEHYRMADYIGGVAPGRWADMVLLNDLRKVKVHTVISNGRPVSVAGRPLAQLKPFSYPARYLTSIKIRDKLSPQRFMVRASGASARVRVIQFVSESITKELVWELPIREGSLLPVPDRDILKAAVIDRHWNTGRLCVGFVKGFGSRLGAVASSVNFDENNLVVIGHREADMAQAANWIRQKQGGIVIVDKGKLLETLPLPLAGTCSLKPASYVGARLNAINQRLRASGSRLERPLNALIFLTFVTLPRIKMTDRGIVDVKKREFLPLFVVDP